MRERERLCARARTHRTNAWLFQVSPDWHGWLHYMHDKPGNHVSKEFAKPFSMKHSINQTMLRPEYTTPEGCARTHASADARTQTRTPRERLASTPASRRSNARTLAHAYPQTLLFERPALQTVLPSLAPHPLLCFCPALPAPPSCRSAFTHTHTSNTPLPHTQIHTCTRRRSVVHHQPT
eukprot:4115494-Pleurochrysis_carterae.AAC.2